MVEQVNSQVKMLRQRAESIVRSCSKPVATPSSHFQPAARGSYHLLQFKLAEAMAVIEEQDRLIHEGQPTSRPFVMSIGML